MQGDLKMLDLGPIMEDRAAGRKRSRDIAKSGDFRLCPVIGIEKFPPLLSAATATT